MSFRYPCGTKPDWRSLLATFQGDTLAYDELGRMREVAEANRRVDEPQSRRAVATRSTTEVDLGLTHLCRTTIDMHIARVLLIANAFGAFFTLPLQANAWGAEGHRLIAEVAERQLSKAARREADRLLDQEPGATLVSIATWADETRSPATARWHYVNFPRDSGCGYVAERSCQHGACVVSAIERQAELLASEAPDDVRLQALKFVVHFVADIHQPLHSGYADDKGGNAYQVQVAGRGSNLHALWDSGLIQQWEGGTPALREAMEHEAHGAADRSPPARWAEQSCRIVVAEDFYPTGHKIDEGYARRWNPVLVQRMAVAARRLSVLLNQALDRSSRSDSMGAR